MKVSEIIAAQTNRIAQLHAVCSKQAATIDALQRQLAAAMAHGGGRQWTAEDVVKSFSVYDPGKVEAIMEALNAKGAPDDALAAVIAMAIKSLDRSDAVELLNTMEHAVYSTPAPPPAPGSLVERMTAFTEAHEPPAAAEERFTGPDTHVKWSPGEAPPMGHDGPAEVTPEGFAVDDESKKPIMPLTEKDLAKVPRKQQGGMADEKVEAPV